MRYKIQPCPVCGEEQYADDTAFQHHVNSHFEDGAGRSVVGREAGPSSPRKRRLSVMKQEEEEGLADDACPLCAFPFFSGVSAADRAQHVNACMDTAAIPNPDSPIPFTITHRPSRTLSTLTADYHLIAQIPIDHPALGPASIPWERETSTQIQLSPTIQLSDQLIQQSIGAGRDDVEIADEWEGPARPGGYVEWRRGEGRKVEKGDGWWDPVKGRVGDVPENFSPGLISVLTGLLESSIHKGITRRAVLGRDAVSITGVFRFDATWGCGYRNALMSISSLISHSPTLAKLFSREANASDPGVRRLQGWLDEAWAKGFDPEGKAHFGGKVLGGRKWVGTGDLCAMFSYKGVPCDLYDFPKSKNPGARPAHKALTEWVKQYFDEGLPSASHGASSAPGRDGSTSVNAFDVLMRDGEGSRGSAVRRADRYPLILQHNGHSRTVVGYEETSRGDLNLLMFDPGKTVPTNIRQAGLRHIASRSASQSTFRPPPARTASHEARHFSPPYTNGQSEITAICDTPLNSSPMMSHPEVSAPRRLDGGSADIAEDEEMDDRGWVRKRLKKLTGDKGMSALGVPRDNQRKGSASSSAAVGAAVGGNGVGEIEVGKGLGYFRVNLSTLGYHAEYQILAFTGDAPLTLHERGKRKYLTSTVIT